MPVSLEYKGVTPGGGAIYAVRSGPNHCEDWSRGCDYDAVGVATVVGRTLRLGPWIGPPLTRDERREIVIRADCERIAWVRWRNGTSVSVEFRIPAVGLEDQTSGRAEALPPDAASPSF